MSHCIQNFSLFDLLDLLPLAPTTVGPVFVDFFFFGLFSQNSWITKNRKTKYFLQWLHFLPCSLAGPRCSSRFVCWTESPADMACPAQASPILFTSHQRGCRAYRPLWTGFNSASRQPSGSGAISVWTSIQANYLRRHPVLSTLIQQSMAATAILLVVPKVAWLNLTWIHRHML